MISPAGPLSHLQHDPVSVAFTIGQRQQDVQRDGRQGQKVYPDHSCGLARPHRSLHHLSASLCLSMHRVTMYFLRHRTPLWDTCQDELSADSGSGCPVVSGARRSCALREMR